MNNDQVEPVIVALDKSASSYNNRAARGQAYNLAVNDAIANNKSNDNKYIAKKFLHYYNLGSLFQEIDIEDLKKELNKDE